MTNRQRFHAVLHYKPYDRLPVVHFGFWHELLEKWVAEGHLKPDEIIGSYDSSEKEKVITKKLGFDFNYNTLYSEISGLFPAFESKTVAVYPDGSYDYLNHEGVIIRQKKGIVSIPMEIGHLLKDRESWETHFLPRLQFTKQRFDDNRIMKLANESQERECILGVYAKSLFGIIRNWLGLEGISYLLYDDEELYDEIIYTVAELAYKSLEYILSFNIEFDFANFWEDICYKNGPLVSPSIFYKKVGPYYKKITDLLKRHNISIISLDCDGCIDSLIPTWFENGINTMFPIEVGTWNASLTPWREIYGRELRGVGGMNKHVFSMNKQAIDKEIERLKPIISLGGFIP